MNDLFEKWGDDCPVEFVVADRAWDNVDAIRECAVDFGIHLIVDRDEPSWNREPTILTQQQSKTIGKFDGRGVAYCRKHNLPTRRSTADFIDRAKRRRLGLRPGQPSNPRAFRLRLECTHPTDPCKGKVHLHMDRDWAALSPYPHTIDGGQQDRHAFRLTMYARRNTSESLNAALKTFHKLGLAGPVRTRTDNEHVVDVLISLALLSRTALGAANERARHGLIAADPPPALLAALASHTLIA